MERTIDSILEQIETLDWNVEQEDGNIYLLSKYSPAGQDFSIQIDTETDAGRFLNNIYATYEEFDVSSEAYIWLDQEGHGTNGAPYDMRDLYDDMEECQQMILDLYSELIR